MRPPCEVGLNGFEEYRVVQREDLGASSLAQQQPMIELYVESISSNLRSQMILDIRDAAK